MDRYWLIKGSVIFAAIVFAVQGRVDEQPERQSAPSKIIGSLFLDIKATDDHQLYAVGERGHICRFDGRQWLMDYSPVRSNLNRIYQSGEGTLWAVGHDGVILKGTQNGWRLIRKIVDDKPLFDIHFFNNDEAVVIGAYGTFLRSYDDGQNWQAELHDSLLPEEDLAYVQEVQQTSPDDYEQVVSSVLPHLNQLTRLANGQLMLLGESGLIAFSSDDGHSWQRIPPIYSGSFFAGFELVHGTQSRLFVAGLRGHIYYSDDGGQHWLESQRMTTATINSFFYSQAQILYALTNNGVVLESKDQGITFQKRKLQEGEAILAAAQRGTEIYIAGDQGLHLLDVTKQTDMD